VAVNTVSKWRKRFFEEGMDGLRERKRSGRPRRFTPLEIAEIKELACELPATSGVPLSRWSSAELARELVSRAVVAAISAATVWRVLHGDAIRPWFHRMWIFPRDPHFAAKAARALDLYARVFEGQPLGDNEFVICADEKTSIQARCRCHPTLPPGKARFMRVEHEYDRGGALAYLAAYDVHRAKAMGRCEDTTGIVPFGALVEQVMTAEPYASAERVFWVVDNGSSHRGQASVKRLEGQWKNLRLIHLPVHASWLDQCEIFVRHEAPRDRVGWKGPPPACHSRSDEAEGSPSLGVQARMGAALTKPGRVGTARRPGSGKQDGAVNARNQCLNPLKSIAGSNLVDVGRIAAHAQEVSGRLRGRFVDVDEEAMGKVCGVPMAMLQGESWSPVPSNGAW